MGLRGFAFKGFRSVVFIIPVGLDCGLFLASTSLGLQTRRKHKLSDAVSQI